MENNEVTNRRELSVRNTGPAITIASWLSRKEISPNQISLTSVVCAIAGFFCLLGYKCEKSATLLLMAAMFIQLRLLCNLFDGMVAVEGGKKTPAGELFNDLPDRIADPLFIIGTGFIASDNSIWIAWFCSLMAVLTAYIRVLGTSMGCPADFCGPMAKQHRMALLTASLILMFILDTLGMEQGRISYVMTYSLWGMLLGLFVTCYRRVVKIFNYKNNRVDHV
ncbi:CDP-alcohol phosphatidyltransferase family protein [Photobacterium sp. J15]|uniref:CDP-alcohol phosphatidyltransferase family protein n=1 Tax=Photobacterium sp. J15 TaxID=265901 RepID=UPI0007E4DB74|nr:CDP-alcohol phosphatidyltransferase family protein [Photobacterium sp. J15]